MQALTKRRQHDTEPTLQTGVKRRCYILLYILGGFGYNQFGRVAQEASAIGLAVGAGFQWPSSATMHRYFTAEVDALKDCNVGKLAIDDTDACVIQAAYGMKAPRSAIIRKLQSFYTRARHDLQPSCDLHIIISADNFSHRNFFDVLENFEQGLIKLDAALKVEWNSTLTLLPALLARAEESRESVNILWTRVMAVFHTDVEVMLPFWPDVRSLDVSKLP
jgi:hypothetical protein